MIDAIRSFLNGSTPVSFASPHSLQESVERLRAATKPIVGFHNYYWSGEEAAVGEVSEGGVSFRRFRSNDRHPNRSPRTSLAGLSVPMPVLQF